MPSDQSGYWSRTVGLGFDEPVTAALMGRVVQFYREHGMSSATVHIAPAVMPADWTGICAKLNISDSAAPWVKLAGDVGAVAKRSRAVAARLDGRLHVERVQAARAREWAEAMWAVYGFPRGPQVEMAAAVVSRPGWQAFAVLDGDTIVATAGLHIAGEISHLFGAATLPGARGPGAQSALIAARAEAAREARCALVIGETGAEKPGQHNTSLHNMLRAGMSACYERQTWKWTAAHGKIRG
jgi:GNAT superfamily N-acetyltransferase